MKQTFKMYLSLLLVVALCVTPFLSQTPKVQAADDTIKVYSSAIWPEQTTEDYYTITVDSVGRKATVVYTFNTSDTYKWLSLNLSANVVTRQNIGGKEFMNSEGVQISGNSFNSMDQKVVTVTYDFSESAIKKYQQIALPNGEGAAAKVESYTLHDTTSEGKLGGDFTIKDGRLNFKPNHSHEVTILTTLNKEYKPASYNTITKDEVSIYNKNGFLDELKEEVKKITAGCSSEKEKYFAIRDWMCKNISYDYLAYDIMTGRANPANSKELAAIAVNPEKVYKYKRAVCDGYASLGRLMLLSAGIPCMRISGLGLMFHGDFGMENSFYSWDDSMISANRDAHAWNAVYLEGSWMFTDFTWDAGGKFYGENSPKNVAPYMVSDQWTNCSAFVFGSKHLAFYGPKGRFPSTKYSLFPKMSIKKATALKGGITVSWNKVTFADGYEIQCSRKSNFSKIDKTIKISSAKTTTKKITKLKKKTTYYVRVRAFVNSMNIVGYSKWSAGKKVKTK